MTVHVLVTGTLFRAGEQRTSSSGRRYVRATIKAAAADTSGAEFFDLMVFSETAGAELERLEVGERVAVQGALKLELYTPEGKPPRISRTIFADHVLALRAPAKERKAKATAATPPERLPPAGRGELDDDIPF